MSQTRYARDGETAAQRAIATVRRLDAEATPGPWKPCGANDGVCACGLIWDATDEDGVFCTPAMALNIQHAPFMGSDEGLCSVEDAAKNAHLIAAYRTLTPALADALETALAALRSVQNDAYQEPWEARHRANKALAAIDAALVGGEGE